MSEPSIFTKIITGEIPSHRIYEDEYTFAFLDIHPAVPGHTLVVPKTQIDRLEDLSGEDYEALMSSVRKVMRRIVAVFGQDYRACLKTEGFDVPHVHVHVLPCRDATDFHAKQHLDADPDHTALAAMAEKLQF